METIILVCVCVYVHVSMLIRHGCSPVVCVCVCLCVCVSVLFKHGSSPVVIIQNNQTKQRNSLYKSQTQEDSHLLSLSSPPACVKGALSRILTDF